MAHLIQILCHHLESLFSVTVIANPTASVVIWVLIFFFTTLFGPLVNDAVVQLGKVGCLELAKTLKHLNLTSACPLTNRIHRKYI